MTTSNYTFENIFTFSFEIFFYAINDFLSKISFEKTQELKYRKSLSLDENYAQTELI